MELNKKQIGVLNDIALTNFDKAKNMLEGINLALDTKYGWVNRRVVIFENPDVPFHEKYAKTYDAWVNAE